MILYKKGKTCTIQLSLKEQKQVTGNLNAGLS